jgi:hypothetical protein
MEDAPPRKRVRFAEEDVVVVVESHEVDEEGEHDAGEQGSARWRWRRICYTPQRLHAPAASRRAAGLCANLQSSKPCSKVGTPQKHGTPYQGTAAAMPLAPAAPSNLICGLIDAANHAQRHPAAGRGGADAASAMREAEDKSVMEDIEAAEEQYDDPDEVGRGGVEGKPSWEGVRG